MPVLTSQKLITVAEDYLTDKYLKISGRHLVNMAGNEMIDREVW